MNTPRPNQKKARQRILESAADSFRTLGYARTTTKQIAMNAGVAEVTLFRHFGDKQKLFQAVAPNIGGGVNFELLEAQLTDDLEADLRLITENAMRFFIAQQDAICMLMFESIHFPEMKEALVQNPRGMSELLEGYFQKQVDAGKMKAIDPHITAQAFISMLFGYAIGVHPVKDLLPDEIPIERMINEFLHIFLGTLQPSE